MHATAGKKDFFLFFFTHTFITLHGVFVGKKKLFNMEPCAVSEYKFTTLLKSWSINAITFHLPTNNTSVHHAIPLKGQKYPWVNLTCYDVTVILGRVIGGNKNRRLTLHDVVTDSLARCFYFFSLIHPIYHQHCCDESFGCVGLRVKTEWIVERKFLLLLVAHKMQFSILVKHELSVCSW